MVSTGFLFPLVYISEHECDSEKATEYFSLSEHFSHPWVPPGYSPFSVLPFTIKFVDVIISAKSTSLPNISWHPLLLAFALSLIRQSSKSMKGFLWSSPEEGHSSLCHTQSFRWFESVGPSFMRFFSWHFLLTFFFLFTFFPFTLGNCFCCPSRFSLWLSFLTTLSCWVILSAFRSPVLFSQHQEHKDSSWGILSLSGSSAFSSALPFHLHLELLIVRKWQGILLCPRSA